MGKNIFKDVNRETYLKALFLDVQKQTKMIDYDRHSKVIESFIMSNSTNTETLSGGLRKINGLYQVGTHIRPTK